MNVTIAKYVTDHLEEKYGIRATIDGKDLIVPLDSGNRHYVGIVQATAYDNSIWGESVPEPMATIAAEWLFNKQLNEYVVAFERLSQYVLLEGRPELTEEVVVETRESFNEETGELETTNITETVITQTAIEPLEEFVEVTEYDEETMESTVVQVRNPLVVKDEEERAAAQAVVDATPQAVIDAINS